MKLSSDKINVKRRKENGDNLSGLGYTSCAVGRLNYTCPGKDILLPSTISFRKHNDLNESNLKSSVLFSLVSGKIQMEIVHRRIYPRTQEILTETSTTVVSFNLPPLLLDGPWAGFVTAVPAEVLPGDGQGELDQDRKLSMSAFRCKTTVCWSLRSFLCFSDGKLKMVRFSSLSGFLCCLTDCLTHLFLEVQHQNLITRCQLIPSQHPPEWRICCALYIS
ncbi:hypothetical protein AV530_000179 [Patagioenas fasciata monilis]|uniref:Uncharacterized protein n=1 Tax=Patagioenas fasciata monilis TaxID=372326 RepID=A0A1V4K9I3_PATFA|nr:hypothetical protein AV530_000179 [Patagioenas fasciata monilis]